jgi:hypothetical protein
MSVPRAGAARGERFATADVRSALYARLSLPGLPATDWYRPRHQPADRDRPRAAVGGRQQPVEAPPDDGSTQRIFRCPTCQVAVYTQYGRAGLRLVRGGTLDQPLERGPGPGGRALVLPATSAPTSGPWHVRGQCVQRLARCRKSCAVVSATSPEALRGRWHCLASDSSRES